MKKTIISTLAMMLAMPAFATPDIALNSNGNGSCVEPVLHRYDGTANLQAGWQANTIQLKWYNGDTQLDVQDAADSCTYDGALTLPSTQPTKTGYTFAGWRVKTGSAAVSGGLCGLTSNGVANAVISEDATHMRWKPFIGSTYTMQGEFGIENSTGLNNGEWEFIDSDGNKYRGVASCNTTQPSYDWDGLDAAERAIYEAMFGDQSLSPEEAIAQVNALYEAAYADPGNFSSASMSSSSSGQYCWCHAESYTPTGGSQCDLSSLSWVFIEDDEDASGCAFYCTRSCASGMAAARRAAVLGVDWN